MNKIIMFLNISGKFTCGDEPCLKTIVNMEHFDFQIVSFKTKRQGLVLNTCRCISWCIIIHTLTHEWSLYAFENEMIVFFYVWYVVS
jgi:hypothetical protein